MATAIHQYEDKLLDFAYGELPAPEASAVESHVKSCVRCTQALDQIRGVRVTMSALPQEPAPTNGLESLLAYAEQAAARHAAAPSAAAPWWRRMVAPLAGACALTLVAVVAIKTQGEVDLSSQTAVLEAKHSQDSRSAPAPVAAAPAPTPAEEKAEVKKAEPPQIAQQAKAGKVAGALRGAEAWDTRKRDDALAKNSNEGYSQELGETKSPAADRQKAQLDELGSSIGTAQKESKSRREVATADFGNARGGYQGKKAEEESQNKKEKTKVLEALKGSGDSSGINTATKAPPPPAPKTAPVLQPPPAQVANSAQASKPSMGLSMPSRSGGTGSAGPGAYKQAPSRDNDDETAARGADDMAERMRLSKDVGTEQRSQEIAAKGYLDAARSASNNGNRQEEVKQSLAVLQTNVKGASRAEALNRLCTALEELGNEGQADKYCDALLQEFPTTAAARLVANRRNNMQRASPAPKSPSKRNSYDSESADKKASEPVQAKPADAKPAAAY